MAAGMVVDGKPVNEEPRPSPPTPPTPPPAVSWAPLVGICAASLGLVLGPFCVAVSLTMTWRVTVMPLRPAVMVTRPPALPVGAKTAVEDGPAPMPATLPRSTPQPAPTGLPFSVAVYFTVGIVWPAATVIVFRPLGSTSKPAVLAPVPVAPLNEMPPVPAVLLGAPPVPAVLPAPAPPPVLPCEAPVPAALLPQAPVPAARASESRSAVPRLANVANEEAMV